MSSFPNISSNAHFGGRFSFFIDSAFLSGCKGCCLLQIELLTILREPFWHLKREDGGKIDDVQLTPSGAKLREMRVVASLDPELFALLQDEQAADLLRGLLIDTYLSSLQTHTTGI